MEFKKYLTRENIIKALVLVCFGAVAIGFAQQILTRYVSVM